MLIMVIRMQKCNPKHKDFNKDHHLLLNKELNNLIIGVNQHNCKNKMKLLKTKPPCF